MALDISVRGSSSGLGAEVTAANELKVILPNDNTKPGAVRLVGNEKYSADVLSNRRLMTSQDSIAFYDTCEAALTFNGLKWFQVVSTHTIVQAGGFITMNNGADATGSKYSVCTSWTRFHNRSKLPMSLQWTGITTNLPETNATCRVGFHNGATNAAPTDGVYFEWDTAGTFKCVLMYNSAPTTVVITAPSDGFSHRMKIIVFNDDVHFYIDEVEVADIDFGTTAVGTEYITGLPLNCQLFTAAGAPALPPKYQFAHILVSQQGTITPWPTQMAAAGNFAGVEPITFAASSRTDISTSSMTLTSNTAPANTTLGGDFLFGAPAGAATNFPMFSYVVPLGYRFVCTGITISAGSYGAACTTTPTVLAWKLAVGSSAATLATTDTATTFAITAPRIIPIGTQLIPVSTIIGYECQPLIIPFTTPIYADSAKYFHIIMSIPIGSATASQIIRGTVYVNGYYE